jgi:uncharacterized membrane protein
VRPYPELAPDRRRRVVVSRPAKLAGRHRRDAEAITGQCPASLIDHQSEPSRRRPWATMWHRHPAVSSADELTAGERAADYMRNGMGSWAFVFGVLLFLAVWITFNVIVVGAGHQAFDAYPFILLNLCLSCLAAMQGAILLIAAKRADQVSSEVAAHDYEVNCRAEMLIAENTELTPGDQRAHRSHPPPSHRGIPSVAADDVLETPTKPQDRVAIGDVRYPRGVAGVERATVGRQAFLSVAAGGGPDCVKRSAEQRGLALLCSSMRSYARAPTESGTMTARAESFFSRGPGSGGRGGVLGLTTKASDRCTSRPYPPTPTTGAPFAATASGREHLLRHLQCGTEITDVVSAQAGESPRTRPRANPEETRPSPG